MTHDSQVIELLGRNLLVAELLQAGLEVALPIRDREGKAYRFLIASSPVKSYAVQDEQRYATPERMRRR